MSVAANDTTLLAPTRFRADRGRIVARLGEKGSGKTTLLRALAGRMTATTGSIRIGGQPVDERDPRFRRSVAVMIGLPPIASDLTGFDHVALVSPTWEERPGSVDAATRRVLDEPEQRLDSGRIDFLAQAMLDRRDAGATIVAATHSSGLAHRAADLTIVLKAQV